MNKRKWLIKQIMLDCKKRNLKMEQRHSINIDQSLLCKKNGMIRNFRVFFKFLVRRIVISESERNSVEKEQMVQS